MTAVCQDRGAHKQSLLFSLSLEGEGWGEGEIVGSSNLLYIRETPPP